MCISQHNQISCSHGPFLIRPYPLGAGKRSFASRTKSGTQRDNVTVKTLEKRNKYLTYLLNWEAFFSHGNQCRLAFLQERNHLCIQNELLESIRQKISLACSVFRGRAQKDVFEVAMFEEKNCFKR